MECEPTGKKTVRNKSMLRFYFFLNKIMRVINYEIPIKELNIHIVLISF